MRVCACGWNKNHSNVRCFNGTAKVAHPLAMASKSFGSVYVEENLFSGSF